MNKTTIKISVLAFLGFMTYGYAQQQQQDPHRGKVGINTIEPSATMDIRPSTANAQKEATTNEGIIAPKLSKTRIANIETPVEGTLVYATDETTSPISAYTGNDPKVAKITEKGYYFYNGTEWMKTSSNLSTSDLLWAKCPGIKNTANEAVCLKNDFGNIELKGNGEKSGIIVRVFSDIPQYSGGFSTIRSRGTTRSPQVIRKGDNLLTFGGGGYDGTTNGNFFNTSAMFGYATKDWSANEHSSNLEFHTTLGKIRKKRMEIYDDGKVGIGTLNAPTSQLEVIRTDIVTNGYNRLASFLSPNMPLSSSSHIIIGKEHSKYNSGSIDFVFKAKDSSTNGIGFNLYASGLNSNPEGPYILFARGDGNVGIGTSSPVEKLDVRGNAKFSMKNNNTRIVIETEIEKYGHLRFLRRINGSNTVLRWDSGMDDTTETGSNQGSNYYFRAFDDSGQLIGNRMIIKRNNGNVGIGVNNPTEKLDVAGNIKSSSLASNAGNRHVYADANGVLKIGTNDVTTLASLWTEDVTNNSIKLAVNSDGSTRSNTVSILDDGKVHASSFMGTNGATIFPDYVFQKYYTGTSSIKADYNFKSLSQVEDFVKANGHLPGYKSAETIKAQGYVDLMETQLTNVEKIEELYLHSIEQDKALKAKDAEIADLKQRLERLEKLIQ
ncbi:hypothetical protein [Bergeyella zoohelcum]|uniref:Uncharacterized protein n=1 Tax=Bergeyella zoohelcum TaxID=1015 RepID=A0A7Z9CG35_9FLAO|nr:hypothetical protein [Bergeyella zoohelcum]VDH04410.1 Uncharacterised protein [Bergeyella zoohelcum]